MKEVIQAAINGINDDLKSVKEEATSVGVFTADLRIVMHHYSQLRAFVKNIASSAVHQDDAFDWCVEQIAAAVRVSEGYVENV